MNCFWNYKLRVKWVTNVFVNLNCTIIRLLHDIRDHIVIVLYSFWVGGAGAALAFAL
jgi:hypothetical protein